MQKHIFKKKYGQHFLYDLNLLKLIITQANLDNQNVIEIGPGKGTLTRLMLNKAKKILLYEIDSSLKPFLIFDKKIPINIIYDDFLNRNLEDDLQKFFQKEDVVLIGNLPYYITTPLLFKIIFLNQIKNFTIMIQKEIGLRLLALPKNKNYNALSVLIQTLTKINKIKIVKKTMFYPQPKVDGIILRFEKKSFQIEELNFIKKEFYIFVKAAFAHKRKNLFNNLNSFFKIPKNKLLVFFQINHIHPNIRGEEISVSQFLNITSLFFDFVNKFNFIPNIQNFFLEIKK
ncbi:MAG: 16S rRNA (adenine(1518)-N(6)/adenine(1519)-N(6))-dimethyltransferase RsmA [Vigna little leaf phytoplasma]|nr:16S rRNA (adenine(1518)-N(6)/adenine(1519)-N(6))-dimethyltransferase RsmA [Vigna little leaf phytoplasma]